MLRVINLFMYVCMLCIAVLASVNVALSGCFDVIFSSSGGCFSGAAKLGVLELVQSNLSALVRTCLLYGGRSTAHKVARLLALCLEYVVYHASHITVGYT